MSKTKLVLFEPHGNVESDNHYIGVYDDSEIILYVIGIAQRAKHSTDIRYLNILAPQIIVSPGCIQNFPTNT